MKKAVLFFIGCLCCILIDVFMQSVPLVKSYTEYQFCSMPMSDLLEYDAFTSIADNLTESEKLEIENFKIEVCLQNNIHIKPPKK